MNPEDNKPEYFQVCLTILEGRHLAWPTMNPVVCIEIDKQAKYTATKESTDCPFYNEVIHARGFGHRNKTLGKVQFDVATVWKQPDHQFYHKWAVLLDHNDPSGSIKGYLKCDITVTGKGDVIKVHPPGTEKDDDDIEGNLLVPEGVTSRRHKACYMVHVYRAEIVTEAKDSIDPYVEVSFAGLKGQTSVRSNSNAPEWNEVLEFNDAFPPLWQRIKVQIRDSNVLSNNVIATHLLDLPTISSDLDTIGFLPTFGPSFVYLYGAANVQKSASPRLYAETWVAILGDGASYRGRLLLALETEPLETVNTLKGSGKRGVTLRSVAPVVEKQCWHLDEYLLVGVVWEVTMLERKYKNKQVHIELSLGSTGNMEQANFQPPTDLDTLRDHLSDLNMEDSSNRNTNPKLWSTTEQLLPQLRDDKDYCSLPYEDTKPCLFVHSKLPDTRHRIYHSNLLARLAHRLNLNITRAKLNEVEDNMEEHLQDILSHLIAGCERYISISSAHHYQTPNINKLDRLRIRLCQNEVTSIMNISRRLQEKLSKNKTETTLTELQDILKKLNLLMEDPQHSLPDLFIWLVVDGKRIGFHRAAAKHFMFSIIPEEKGMNCGHLQAVLLKAPAKAGENTVNETLLPAKIDVALWLGRSKHAHACFKSLPTGYETLHGFGPHHLCHERYPILPREICYSEKHKFEFRAYIHQGRLKPGSDSTALCDAFVRVVIGGWSKVTQIEKASLNPTWDQTLVVKEVILPGANQCLKSQPPVIVVEVFDMDVSLLQSKTELVGRTTARPHVRLAEETYTNDEYMPQLQWHQLYIGKKITGEILATFELLELSETMKGPELPQDLKSKVVIYRLPEEIKPHIVKHRMEVLFWGLRNMKKLNMFTVKKPQVTAECQDILLHSTVLASASQNPNFTQPLQFLELELPKQTVYHPPLTFTINDQRSFGRSKYVGTHIQHSVSKFLISLDTREQHAAKLQSVIFPPSPSKMLYDIDDNILQNDSETTPLLKTITRRGTLTSLPGYDTTLLFTKRNLKKIVSPFSKSDENASIGTENEKGMKVKTEEKKLHFSDIEEDESFDWWAKYYASLQISDEEPFDFFNELLSELPHSKRGRKQRAAKRITLKIYPTELETQPEFGNFNDFLQCFEIYRGKTTGDEILDRENVIGTLKGTVKLYHWPPPKGIELVTKTGLNVADGGVLQDMPTNDSVRILVRVYVVRASGLHSKDLSGKSDPYLMVELGRTVISDSENYIPRQLNPIFGRYFELEAILPMEYMLTVRVMDNDIAATDDLIGETKIDLENRFYSRHRATCGIASYYHMTGYNKWRDSQKPTEILNELCKKHRINPPLYGSNKIVLGGITSIDMTDVFSEARLQMEEDPEEEYKREILALYALHKWHEVPYIGYHLVPEHVETRSLFHPDKLGIEQGKIEMWVDMFPVSELPPPPPFDIAPRKPQEYELRVIVWNTEDVTLQEDSFVSGERMSDIYVRGYLPYMDTCFVAVVVGSSEFMLKMRYISRETRVHVSWLLGKEDMQYTDVHYRSLTGEGNFNWRFVFTFSYLSAEDKIVSTKQESFFTSEVTEIKSPCRLNLQVFDNDTFSKDDFLGALILNLASMPRGARTAKQCSLDILSKDALKINLFKINRTKGWWPFKAPTEDKIILTGKVELEFQLVTLEEAEKNPVGIGRSPPEALPQPKRPDTSFLWFKNPWRSLKYIFWRNYKWCLLKTLIVAIIILFIVVAIYSIPGYTIKRILGA